MLFITETVDRQQIDIICEQDEKGKRKSYKIKGPFLQAEVENKNSRIYPLHVLEREVNKYNKEMIANKISFGSLDHPVTPTVELQQASHIIESLVMEGNDGIGVAKLLDTPNGRIAESILDAGARLGVSTRGVGSITGKIVDDSFHLIAVDIVAQPSAPSAFVDGIREGKEYIIQGDVIIEQAVVNFEKKLVNGNSKMVSKFMNEFLTEINSKWNDNR